MNNINKTIATLNHLFEWLKIQLILGASRARLSAFVVIQKPTLTPNQFIA